MKEKVDRSLREFLSLHHRGGALLLALSGGPDSLALFYALLRHKISFHALHLDHGWRKESVEESRLLQELCAHHGISSHFTRKEKADFQGNLEEAGREARLAFFREIQEKIGAEAILLAHHQDDLVEGVLKRLFEGVRFFQLEALRPIVTLGSLTLWRPWLHHSKDELRASLEGISAVEDPTNLSSQFLRGRIRSELLPLLSHHFGKEVKKPLVRIAKESLDMRDYLHHRIEPILKKKIDGPFGIALDYSQEKELPHPYEFTFFVDQTLRALGVPCQKKQIEEIVEQLYSTSTKGSKKYIAGNIEVIIDRRRLFFVTARPSFSRWLASNGTPGFGGSSSWKEAWQGRLLLPKPEGDFRWISPEKRGDYPDISKRWSDQKVPTFMRSWFPIVIFSDGTLFEFLTDSKKTEEMEWMVFQYA